MDKQKWRCYIAVSLMAVITIGTAFITYNDYNNTQVNDKVDVITSAEKEISDESSVTENNEIEVIDQEQKQEEVNEMSESISLIQYSVPKSEGGFKSYTNYRLLNKSSQQWQKIQCDENAYTDENGLRKIENHYLVAMGSYYVNSLGDIFEITTEGGSFKVLITDVKSDTHTDNTNRYTVSNGCMVEFYVDINLLNSRAKTMGDVSCINNNFQGNIISVTYLGNYFEQ